MQQDKLNILAISVVFPPEWEHGGTPVTAYEVSNHLQKLGHNVLSVATGNIDNDDIPKIDEVTKWNGVPIFYGKRRDSLMPFYSKSTKEFINEVASKYDVASIRSSWTYLGSMASKILKKKKIPYIAYAEGNFEKWSMKRSVFKKKLFWILYDKSFFEDASILIALTKSEADSYRRMGLKNRIEIIPNGINVENFKFIENNQDKFFNKYPLLKNKNYFLFLSRIHPKKGVENLILAFEKFSKHNSDVFLVIAGSGDEEYVKKIKIMIKKLMLETKIILTGIVTGEHKVSLLHNAKIFILPSYSEGFTMAILEAMACKKPIIYTYGCNFPELAENKAGLIVNSKVDELSEAMKLINNNDQMNRLSKNAYDLVINNYSWDRIAQLTEKVLKSIRK